MEWLIHLFFLKKLWSRYKHLFLGKPSILISFLSLRTWKSYPICDTDRMKTNGEEESRHTGWICSSDSCWIAEEKTFQLSSLFRRECFDSHNSLTLIKVRNMKFSYEYLIKTLENIRVISIKMCFLSNTCIGYQGQ